MEYGVCFAFLAGCSGFVLAHVGGVMNVIRVCVFCFFLFSS